MPLTNIVDEAGRLLELAIGSQVPLKLIGGLAVQSICPSARVAPLSRSYKDLDFVIPVQVKRATEDLLTGAGYKPDKTFNTLHGHERLFFWDEEHERQVDIFVDRFRLCHHIDLRSRLAHPGPALTPADLLLTKLQVVEINEKDLIDLAALLTDQAVAQDDASGFNLPYILKLTAEDWGLWRTISINLDKVMHYAETAKLPTREVIGQKANLLVSAMASQPKSLRWKARAVIGERVQWYELPEENAR